MTDMLYKSLGMPRAMVTKTIAGEKDHSRILLCGKKKFPWDLHDTLIDRDCRLLSLLTKVHFIRIRVAKPLALDVYLSRWFSFTSVFKLPHRPILACL